MGKPVAAQEEPKLLDYTVKAFEEENTAAAVVDTSQMRKSVEECNQ